MLLKFPKILLIVVLFFGICQFFLLFASVPALAAPNTSMPTWSMPEPKLQIPIDTIKFTAPERCGGTDEQPVYCVKWIGQYVVGLYKYAIGVVGILAAVVLMVGGIIWLTAGGSAGRIGEAKSWISASLAGLVIALSSYLILYQINPDLVSFKPIKVQMAKTMPMTTATIGTLEEGDARSKIIAANQSAGSHAVGYKQPCPTNGPYTNCVNLAGLRDETLNEIIKLSKDCSSCAAYEVTITGGTEPGHATTGVYNHGNGYKLDLRPGTNLDTYIKNNFTKIETRSDGAEQWRAPSGAIYALETYGAPHWDVTVK